MVLTFVRIGPSAELNVFEVQGNAEPQRQTPMFGRGRIDHLGLQAGSLGAFDTIRDRLIERRSTDGFVTDFGPVLSLFFRDPDASSARCACPTRTPYPVCTTRPGRRRPAIRRSGRGSPGRPRTKNTLARVPGVQSSRS